MQRTGKALKNFVEETAKRKDVADSVVRKSAIGRRFKAGDVEASGDVTVDGDLTVNGDLLGVDIGVDVLTFGPTELASGASTTYTHDLGFAPQCIFVQVSTTSSPLNWRNVGSYPFAATGSSLQLVYHATDTTLVITNDLGTTRYVRATILVV